MIFIEEDATLAFNFPNTNFGQEQDLVVQGGSAKCVMKIPAAALAAHPFLHFFIFTTAFVPQGYDLFGFPNSNWDEDTITWNNAPLFPQVGNFSLVYSGIPGWFYVDLTSLILAGATSVLFGGVVGNPTTDLAIFSSEREAEEQEFANRPFMAKEPLLGATDAQ